MKFNQTIHFTFVFSLLLLISPSLAGANWISFQNPHNVKSMQNQIYQKILKMVQNRTFTNYNQIQRKEESFDQEKQSKEKHWETTFRKLDRKVKTAYDNLLIARSVASSKEAQRKYLAAKKRQLYQAVKRLSDHKSNLKNSL
ncbi:MAG: esterase/lipase, partial [bacterium]